MKVCEHHDHKPLDYHYITDGIYLGATISHDCTLDKELQDQKITADISVEKSRIDTPFGVDFFAWIPVTDHWSLTQDQLDFGVGTLKQIVLLGRRAYVHCEHGHGRSPSLIAAYLITKGYTVDEAIKFLNDHRPSVSFNLRQTKSLVSFAKRQLLS